MWAHFFAVTVVALWLCCAGSGALPANPSVTYDDGRGTVMGRRETSGGLREGVEARDFAAFWGVPYAEPPVGERRFRPPVGKGLPDGVFRATNMSTPVCLQQGRAPLHIHGEEDCLTLQIFTPNMDRPNLPVLVLIHGGGFMFGQGPRSGVQFIMDYDVVLVNVDYRLGVLGYMSFEDSEMPGNMGMLDQVQALKWVQENIHHFGGNNKSVTLVGPSAGSASCLLHTMSPLSKGLFHRVIGMSGTPLNPWTQQHSARESALRIANLTNCSNTSTAAMVHCLQNKTATELVALQGKHFQFWMDNPFSPFAPVVDKHSRTPFLPDEPHRLLSNKKAVMDVPLLLSFTTHEGLYTAGEFVGDDTLLRELDQNWETVAPQLLHFHDQRVSKEDKPVMARKIREHYLKNASLVEAKDTLVQLMGDRNFIAGVSEHIQLRAAAQSSPVYVYQFAHRGQYSLYPNAKGVSHADDFQYLIEFTTWSGPFTRAADTQVRRSMVQMWTSFANSSKPMIPGVTWEPMPKSAADGVVQFLRISGPNPVNMTMAKGTDIGHGVFWRDLGIKENANDCGRLRATLSLAIPTALLFMIMYN